MRLAWITLALAMLIAASGCSDDDGGSKTPVSDPAGQAAATATANAVNFDPDDFTAIALQPEDVPDGLVQNASFSNEYGGDVASYTASYAGPNLSIASTIGHATPGKSITQAVFRLRTAQTALIRLERNYTIDGADQAFAYGPPPGTVAATLVLKSGYYVSIVVQSRDTSATEAQNQANLDRYTKLVFDRLKAYVDDPASVTPVPGTPRYVAPVATPG